MFNRTPGFMVLVILSLGSLARADLVTINGTDFVTHIDNLKALVVLEDSEGYQVPVAQNLTDFRALADALWTAAGDAALAALEIPANALGYDVVKLTDNGVTYYGLQENTNFDKGWGNYFVRQGNSRNALLEAPHPLNDSNTPEVAAMAFVQSESRGFLMAGAHRNANAQVLGGHRIADVAHQTGSIFHQVHESWSGLFGENTAWQVHGFNLDTHVPPFPLDTDAVLSNGTGGVSPEIIALDQAIEALGPDWESYAYNTLNVNDPLNTAVNGLIDGSTFGGPDGLGATTNVQKTYSVGLGGTFVHIELEQSFRLDNGAAGIPLAADAIADAIIATTALLVTIPTPSAGALGLLGMVGLMVRRRQRG